MKYLLKVRVRLEQSVWEKLFLLSEKHMDLGLAKAYISYCKNCFEVTVM